MAQVYRDRKGSNPMQIYVEIIRLSACTNDSNVCRILYVPRRDFQKMCWSNPISRHTDEIRSPLSLKTQPDLMFSDCRKLQMKISRKSKTDIFHNNRRNRFSSHTYRLKSLIFTKPCIWNDSCIFTPLRKGKSVPLQAWSGPECSRQLRFTDFLITAQDSGKVVSLMHRSPLPPRKAPVTQFYQRLSRPQDHSAIGRILCQ